MSKRRQQRRQHQTPRKLRRKVLRRQTAVDRQEKRQRHRFTLNLRFWEQVSKAHLQGDSADVREHREILAKFCEVLGDDWTKHARKKLPEINRRPEDCDLKRPCRKILCEYHLAVEQTRLGSLRLVHPDVPIKQQQTCQWDVIKHNPDGLSLEAIGELFAMGRPRVHGIWREIQAKLRKLRPDLACKLEEDLLRPTTPASAPAVTLVRIPTLPTLVTPPPVVLTSHPAACIFPALRGEELDALVADIKAHGLHERIVLYDGQILDGRNRYAACLLARVEPLFVEWDPRRGETAVDYVLSRNLHRRHLDESQRAMVAAKVREMLMPEARERQGAGLKQGARVSVGTNSPPREKTAVQAAVALNVSSTSVKSASTVLELAEPELVKAVQDGRVSVSAAAKVATLPPAKQRKIAAGGKTAVAKAAQKIRKKKARDTLIKRSVDKPAQVVDRLLRDVRAAVEEAVGKWPAAVPKRCLVVLLRDFVKDVERA